tara:strand:- start:100 stop:339 length:240 start_codon:yes stop_codon:yes gene_type:complete
MKGRRGKISRRERAIPLIESHIVSYEETLSSYSEELKVSRKEKDNDKIVTLEKLVKFCEKKLKSHKECLENTQRNLKLA